MGISVRLELDTILQITFAQQGTTVLNLPNPGQLIRAHLVPTMITQVPGVKLNVDQHLRASIKICRHKLRLSPLKFVKLATIAKSVHILQLQEQPLNLLVFYSLILADCVKQGTIVHREPQFRSLALLAINVLQQA